MLIGKTTTNLGGGGLASALTDVIIYEEVLILNLRCAMTFIN